jgi:hypothetical protein
VLNRFLMGVTSSSIRPCSAPVAYCPPGIATSLKMRGQLTSDLSGSLAIPLFFPYTEASM